VPIGAAYRGVRRPGRKSSRVYDPCYPCYCYGSGAGGNGRLTTMKPAHGWDGNGRGRVARLIGASVGPAGKVVEFMTRITVTGLMLEETAV